MNTCVPIVTHSLDPHREGSDLSLGLGMPSASDFQTEKWGLRRDPPSMTRESPSHTVAAVPPSVEGRKSVHAVNAEPAQREGEWLGQAWEKTERRLGQGPAEPALVVRALT